MSPESLSTCLTKTGKNLSSSYCFYLLVISTSESTITPFQVASNLLCNAPVRICVVFVRPHRYLFIILESGNMFLNSLTAWSAVLKGRLGLTKKTEKSSSALTTFWSNFAVVDLSPKLVTFFVVVLHPHILICYPHITYPLKCPCVYWYHFHLHLQHWNFFHTVYKAKSSRLRDFWMNLNLLHHESLNSTHYIFLWRS